MITLSPTMHAINFYSMGLQPEQIARLMNLDLCDLAQLVSKYITF